MENENNIVRASGSAKLIAVLVLLLTAAAGIMGGVAIDRLLLLPGQRPLGGRLAFAGPPGGDGPRGRPPGAFRERFARELSLTAEQEKRVDALMSRQMEAISRIHEQTDPQIRTIIEQTRSAIDSVLTPEQRGRMREMGVGFGRGARQTF
jgi:hypothetical protein